MIITFSAILGIIQAGLWTKDIVTSLVSKSSNFDKVTKSLIKAYKTAFNETFGIKIEDMSYFDEQTEKFIKGGDIDIILHLLSYLENPDFFAENVISIPGISEEFKGYTKDQLIKKFEDVKKEFEKQIPETESLAIALKFLIGIDEKLRNNNIIIRENNRFLTKIITILEANDTTEFKKDILDNINIQIVDSLQEIKKDTEKILDSTNNIEKWMEKINGKLPEILDELGSTKYLEFEIQRLKSRIDKNQLLVAQEDLEQFEKEFWDKLNSKQKYQLKSLNAQLHLIRNEKDKGADLLIESYYCEKNAERALFNISYGYYLKKDYKNSQKYNDKFLKKCPNNADAITIKILLTNIELSTDELIATLPEELLHVPKIAFHIAEFARNRREYEEAFKWFELAIKTDQSIVYEMKAIYAKSLIDYVINNEKFYHRLQITNDLIEKLNKAEAFLKEAWEEVEKNDLNKIYVDWLSDIAIIKHLLGETNEAIEILDKGIKISAENELLNRNKGVILLESGYIQESIHYLNKIFSDNPKSDIVFKLSIAYKQLNQEDKAIEILNHFVNQKISILNKIQAERSLFDLHYQTGNLEKAKETLEKYSNDIYKRIDQSRFQIYEKNYEESVRILDNLVNDKIQEMGSKDIFELANGYYESKEYNKSAIYYEKIVDVDKYSPILFRFIYSLNNCGRKDEALTITEQIRKNEGFIAEIINIETSILEEIGDLDKITEIYEDGLSNNPDDYQLLLNLAIQYMRQEEAEKIQSILQYPFIFDELTLDQGFQLSYIFVENDLIEKAFNLIYELRRKFYDQEKAHLHFSGFFFSYDNQLSTKIKLINVEKVTNNCAVYVNENGINKIYVLDDREDTNLIRFKEINTQHPLYLQLINKSKGDELELKESPYSTKKITILDIMHKYTYAFNETLNNYNDFFPSGTGMFKISLNLPKDKTASKENFAPMFKGADELKEKTNFFEDLYKSNPIPISFVSKQSGFHIFDIMFGFASNEDIGIRCCTGDEIERQNALNEISFGKNIVLDMTSIFTLHHLKLLDTVKGIFELVISQSTIDEIDVILNERKLSLGKDVVSIGKIDDQYTKTEYSIEQNIKYYDTLNNLKKWLLKNCEIKTVEKRFEYNAEIIKKLDKSIGKSSVDSIILSSYEKFILLSDDLILRQLAMSDFNIDSIWTQILLMYLRNQDKISNDEYQKCLIDLVCMNYKHTSINHDTIIKATKMSQYNINYPLTKVVANLGGNYCDPISALRVVDQTIYEYYNVIVLELSRNVLVNNLLDSATKNRDERKFIHALILGISEKYKLHPIYRNYVLRLLKKWLETRFLK